MTLALGRAPAEGHPDAHPEAPGGRQVRGGLVLATTILGSSIAFIDASVVSVALPAIQADLDASLGDMSWVVNGYVLFLASLILIGGSLGDHLGRAWSGFGALTSAGGPVFGGWLVDAWGWEAVFLINVPIAAATVLMAAAVVPESRGGEKGGIDWTGAVLAALGLGLFAFGLVRLSEAGADAASWGALAGGAGVFGAFVLWEGRSSQPMAPLGLFRSRTFSGVNLVTVLLYSALGGALFLVPFQLINEDGYSAAEAGAAFLPFSLPLGLLSGAAGGQIKRFGVRRPLFAGALITGVALASMGLLAEADGAYLGGWFWSFLALGLGMTLVVAPLTTPVFNSVPDEMSGVASGVNNALARTAQLIAVAAAGALAAAFGFQTAVLWLSALAVLAGATALLAVDDEQAAPQDEASPD